jgi:hypothetical protein
VNKFQTLARNISLGESVTTAIHHEAAAAGVVGASAAALARAEEKVASAQETLKAAVGAAAQNSAGSKLKTAEAERDAAKALHEKAQNELAKRKGVVEYYKNSVKSSESKNPAPDNPPSSESDASEIAEKAALTNGIKEIQDGGETKDSDVDKDPKPASKIGAAKTTKVESQPLPK